MFSPAYCFRRRCSPDISPAATPRDAAERFIRHYYRYYAAPRAMPARSDAATFPLPLCFDIAAMPMLPRDAHAVCRHA